MAAFEATLPMPGEAAPWADDTTADATARIRDIGRAPLPGAPRRRVLEPVPPFAFLAMPEQDLG
jgi:hypothetical protein